MEIAHFNIHNLERYEKPNGRNTRPDLTNSQYNALELLTKWYKSNELECLLEGPAGTGKTYLVNIFLNEVVKKTNCITAPTHKALRVLETRVGKKGVTLQSLHGLKPNMDLANFNIQHPQFDPLATPKIQNYSLVIIDEASMINADLFQLNHDKTKEHRTKILYLGDRYQLPPVNEDISKVFTSVKTRIVLTDIIRQEGDNPLLDVFPLLREDIEDGGSRFLRYITQNKEGLRDKQGYVLMPIAKFQAQILKMFQDDKFNKDIDYLRFTGYTNRIIGNTNQSIRNAFYGAESKSVINHDDLFTAYNTIVDEYGSPIIINSEDYIIYDCRPYFSDEGIQTFAVNFKSMYDGRITPSFLIVDHTNPSFNKFVKVLDVLHANATSGQRGGWHKYYRFKNRFLTMIDFQLPVAKRIVKKDIDYGYALTTHKLQGSTFENIAVDLTDIVYGVTRYGKRIEREPIMRNKLIYVAMSRAKNAAILKF